MKISTATIAKANALEGFYSITGVPVSMLFMSSRADYLEVQKVPGVSAAATQQNWAQS